MSSYKAFRDIIMHTILCQIQHHVMSFDYSLFIFVRNLTCRFILISGGLNIGGFYRSGVQEGNIFSRVCLPASVFVQRDDCMWSWSIPSPFPYHMDSFNHVYYVVRISITRAVIGWAVENTMWPLRVKPLTLSIEHRHQFLDQMPKAKVSWSLCIGILNVNLVLWPNGLCL